MTPPRIILAQSDLRKMLEDAEADGYRKAMGDSDTYPASEVEDLMARIGEKVGHPDGCHWTLKATTLETIEHLATRHPRLCGGWDSDPLPPAGALAGGEGTSLPFAGAVGADTLAEVEDWLEAQASGTSERSPAHRVLEGFRFRFGTSKPSLLKGHGE